QGNSSENVDPAASDGETAEQAGQQLSRSEGKQQDGKTTASMGDDNEETPRAERPREEPGDRPEQLNSPTGLNDTTGASEGQGAKTEEPRRRDAKRLLDQLRSRERTLQPWSMQTESRSRAKPVEKDW
ncbi:MAG: hypothetical protein ACO3JL_05515, partial [Myxococcota bacterium]